MALSTALYSGISGLTTLGNAMQIIGDNIANVNTVGFKGSSFNFQDVLSQTVTTMSGTAQVGRGTALGDISAGFQQGSFESTGSTTDLAIGGEGFFVVRDASNTTNYYTRAGNFHFDTNGYMVNPDGYVVQGKALDATGNDTGSVTDILLSSFTSPPSATTNSEVIVNLSSEGGDNSVGANALSAAWDGSLASPISSAAYEYQTTLKVFDSLGNAHDVSIYFDKGAVASTYEYIVTTATADDKRAGITGTSHAGLLARGTITFGSATGKITDINLDQSDGVAGTWTAQAEAADLSNGFFTWAPTFITGSPMSIELNFGASSDVAATWTTSSLTTTQYATASTTTFQSSNGYGAGDLQSVGVDVEGKITGTYSNGELIPLFRVHLAKFQSLNGLKKEGANLFSETADSGTATTGQPGNNGLGGISANSLEQSNVDIATELVRMITTQRGFQANSKIITVTDQMLAELIQLKR